MRELETIDVSDVELFRDGVISAYDLYQGDLFRGYISKGFYRDPACKMTHFLVYKNPKGKDEPLVEEK